MVVARRAQTELFVSRSGFSVFLGSKPAYARCWRWVVLPFPSAMGEAARMACPGGRGEARAGSTGSYSEVVPPKSFVRNRSCAVARTQARAKALDWNTRRPKGERVQPMVVQDRDGTEISDGGTRVTELHDFQTNILKICDLISRTALQRLLSE
jgi:hypothetical protein